VREAVADVATAVAILTAACANRRKRKKTHGGHFEFPNCLETLYENRVTGVRCSSRQTLHISLVTVTVFVFVLREEKLKQKQKI
jgi:uncharacterized protein YjhX (UPF0386 family)